MQITINIAVINTIIVIKQQHQQHNKMIHLKRAHGHRIVGLEMKNRPEGDQITLWKSESMPLHVLPPNSDHSQQTW
jgi:hypothetical protein